MAEFDPTSPKDAAEAAFARALLADESGRDERRARLMAALPRPEAVAAVPVSQSTLAWRWQPYALGVLALGLLLATVLALRGRPAEPRPETDPRLVAAQSASTATVVAQASPAAEPSLAPVAEAPRVAAKASPPRPRAEQPAPVVVADATLPRSQRETETKVAAVAEPAMPALAPPPPAAPAIAAAPPRAVADASNQAEALARLEAVPGGAVARARAAPQAAQSLAASDVAAPIVAVNANLRAAVVQANPAAARTALQAGASVHQRDAQGRTVLMLAARTGSREMVDLLLAAGARRADRDPQGWTAADHAEAQGHGDLVGHLR